ncbi:hypothetical protein [Aliiglaciecola aliphaticivorans]
MQKITIALFCIAILLINSVSVSVHAFEDVGIHTHVYTQSVDADDTTVHSSEESAQSCYCPHCFYSDNTNSNMSLAIVPLSAWLMPVTMGTDNFIEVFVTLTRSIPPDIPPPITFLFQA